MEMEYKLAKTEPPTPDVINRVKAQFQAAGCRVR
jgi:hypothetical protein